MCGILVGRWGVRIGDARTGWVSAFILYPWGDPRVTAGNEAKFVAVDRDGNLYGAEPRPGSCGSTSEFDRRERDGFAPS